MGYKASWGAASASSLFPLSCPLAFPTLLPQPPFTHLIPFLIVIFLSVAV